MYKKFIVFSLCALFFKVSFSQSAGMRLCLGKTDEDVTHYLDSLTNHSTEYIKRGIDAYGNLMIYSPFSIFAEDVYTCTSVTFKFSRIKGIERCVWEALSVSPKYAEGYISHLKDNYKQVAENTWEFSISSTGKIVATLDTKDDHRYSLIYELISI